MNMKGNFFVLLVFNIIVILGVFYQSSNYYYQTSANYKKTNWSNEFQIFDEIFNCSKEQNLIDKSIMLKAISFMIQETDEFDPKLIEFVRSLIWKPSKERKLNLTQPKRKDFSQIGQSKWVDKVLEEKRNGFFIEAGGYDGEIFSNTLFFELERGWTGILIEPVPSFYASILSKNRNIFSINACIANEKPIVAKLRVGGALTGRLKEMKAVEISRMEKEYVKNQLSTLYVPCFSLNTILSAIGINKVDYFSLDVEGGELDVLKSIKHDKITIDTFTIEHNGFQDRKIDIISHLEAKGFKKLAEDNQDVYFKRIL